MKTASARSITRLAALLVTAGLLVAAPVVAQAEKADLVRIVKSERRLYLMKNGKEVDSFHATFGADPKGHKQRRGDERTPEGRYTLSYKNPHSSFYRSIHISYPNARDREKARTMGVDPGGDIMIHGQKNGVEWLTPLSQLFNWTDGCVALTNADMDRVWDSVDAGTPIEIYP
jgi:murein L,D-transpeptidase YafK